MTRNSRHQLLIKKNQQISKSELLDNYNHKHTRVVNSVLTIFSDIYCWIFIRVLYVIQEMTNTFGINIKPT